MGKEHQLRGKRQTQIHLETGSENGVSHQNGNAPAMSKDCLQSWKIGGYISLP